MRRELAATARRSPKAAPDDYATALEIFQDAASFWQERGSTFVVLVDVEPEGVKMRRFRPRRRTIDRQDRSGRQRCTRG